VLVATACPAKVVANVNVLKYKFIFLPPFMLDSAFIQAYHLGPAYLQINTSGNSSMLKQTARSQAAIAGKT